MIEINNNIETEIKNFVKDSPSNSLFKNGKKAWDEPIIGFASGNDPIFEDYKIIISPDYWLPIDFLNSDQNIKVDSNCCNVICWILPITEDTANKSKGKVKIPSEEWIGTREFGEEFNDNLRRYVVNYLKGKNYKAVAPVFHENWIRANHVISGYCNRWSERHTAYVCGLGTFGFCDGLITEKGKAVRIG
ncbi:MAG: hypothetical protein K8S16_17940, partial [Bacteroidales bacterium]|nr:hypothetical protein [Bacteroidales bacterium]